MAVNILEIKSELDIDDSPSMDINSIVACRTCLENDHLFHMQNIFDDEPSVLDLLNQLTPNVQVRRDDDFPHQMCHKCVEQLTQAIAFKKQIEMVDSLLHGAQKELEHEAAHSKDDANETGVSHTNIQESTEAQPNQKKGYFCAICLTSFAYAEDLDVHMSVHSKTSIWRCSNCKKKFRNRAELRQHIVEHFKENPFECDICGRKLFKKESLHYHLLRHVGRGLPNKYQCELCPKSYTSSANLQIHLRVHSGLRPFQCEECDMKFTCLANLRSHLLVHEDRKDYTCNTCSKRFKHSSTLTAHVRAIHTRSKPYACTHCSKAFVNASKLRRHQTVHDKLKMDGQKGPKQSKVYGGIDRKMR